MNAEEFDEIIKKLKNAPRGLGFEREVFLQCILEVLYYNKSRCDDIKKVFIECGITDEDQMLEIIDEYFADNEYVEGFENLKGYVE